MKQLGNDFCQSQIPLERIPNGFYIGFRSSFSFFRNLRQNDTKQYNTHRNSIAGYTMELRRKRASPQELFVLELTFTIAISRKLAKGSPHL